MKLLRDGPVGQVASRGQSGLPCGSACSGANSHQPWASASLVLRLVPREGGALESGWTEQVLFPLDPSPGSVFGLGVFPVLHLPVRVVLCTAGDSEHALPCEALMLLLSRGGQLGGQQTLPCAFQPSSFPEAALAVRSRGPAFHPSLLYSWPPLHRWTFPPEGAGVYVIDSESSTNTDLQE